ncbi:MAG: hypothetical protein Q8S26_05485 [Azonexus sp.]|nr:hypothetical protein [Azonexus sp.]
MNGLNGSKSTVPRIITDRRTRENGPPNGCDRRKNADRRLPKVEEGAVSEAEWFKRMAIFKLKLKARERARIDKLQCLASGSSH